MWKTDRVNYRLRRAQRVERKYAKMLFSTDGVIDVGSSERGIEVLAYSAHGDLPDRLDGFPVIVFKAAESLSNFCGCGVCQEVQADVAAERAIRWCN